jgi:hypothetical protein
VSEGPTDPASCELVLQSSIQAGEVFELKIETFDVHTNPTEHPVDTFSATLTTVDGEEAFEITRESNLKFSRRFLAAGRNNLRIVHVPTNSEVVGSPFTIDVVPGAPDRTVTTHNIQGSKKEIDSTSASGGFLELIVDPMDRFGNSVPDATGFAVTINGVETHNLTESLEFTHKHPVFVLSASDIELSFTLDGEEIAGSPVIVKVFPTSAINFAIGLGVALLILGVFGNKVGSMVAFDTSAEKIVTVDEKLRKILDTKIRSQNMFIGIEVSAGTRGSTCVLRLTLSLSLPSCSTPLQTCSTPSSSSSLCCSSATAPSLSG